MLWSAVWAVRTTWLARHVPRHPRVCPSVHERWARPSASLLPGAWFTAEAVYFTTRLRHPILAEAWKGWSRPTGGPQRLVSPARVRLASHCSPETAMSGSPLLGRGPFAAYLAAKPPGGVVVEVAGRGWLTPRAALLPGTSAERQSLRSGATNRVPTAWTEDLTVPPPTFGAVPFRGQPCVAAGAAALGSAPGVIGGGDIPSPSLAVWSGSAEADAALAVRVG